MIRSCFSARHRVLGMMICMTLALIGPLRAECPPAAKLLPENTIFLVSTPNARELQEKFFNTNIGRMLQDPQLKPLIDRLRGDLAKALEQVKSEVGLSLDEMLETYQGQIAFAVIDMKMTEVKIPNTDRTFQAPQPVMAMIFEAGDKMPLARRLIQKGMDALEKAQGKKQEETVGGVKLTVFTGIPRGRPDFVFFEKENTVVITTSLEAAKDMLAAWDGKNKNTLSENPTYATVMSRCRGSRDENPQILFYLDIQNYLRLMSKMMPGQAAVMMAMMSAQGLDGLLGIGGGAVLDDSRFDAVLHAHLALDSPRSGILKIIALEPGPYKPEYWVPADAVKYSTFHWNFQKSFEALTKLIDSIMGEGAVNGFLTVKLQQETGVDLQKEVLPNLDGRITTFSWIQRPITEESGQSVIAIKLKDAEKIKQALDKLKELHSSGVEKVSYAGKTYFRSLEKPDPNKPFQYLCFGLLDDYLIVGSRPAIYEKALLTATEGKNSLGDEPDFKLVMSKVGRISGETPPGMVTFERQDETLRYFYDLALSERAKKFLQKEEQRNPFFKSINSAMESNPLPSFETLRKYLAPGGAIITDDETGIHYMDFTLKRKADESSEAR